jgi:hypothetical protein
VLESSSATIIINMNGCCQDNLGRAERALMGRIGYRLKEKAGYVPSPESKKAITLLQKALQ